MAPNAGQVNVKSLFRPVAFAPKTAVWLLKPLPNRTAVGTAPLSGIAVLAPSAKAHIRPRKDQHQDKGQNKSRNNDHTRLRLTQR